jgi:hypothetical protein
VGESYFRGSQIAFLLTIIYKAAGSERGRLLLVIIVYNLGGGGATKFIYLIFFSRNARAPAETAGAFYIGLGEISV